MMIKHSIVHLERDFAGPVAVLQADDMYSLLPLDVPIPLSHF